MSRFKHKITSWPFGQQGEFSKIEEEYAELQDAHNQGDKLFALIETSDMAYALARYSWKQFRVPFIFLCIFAAIRRLYKPFRKRSSSLTQG